MATHSIADGIAQKVRSGALAWTFSAGVGLCLGYVSLCLYLLIFASSITTLGWLVYGTSFVTALILLGASAGMASRFKRTAHLAWLVFGGLVGFLIFWYAALLALD
jgi:hypothetical protein